MFGRMTATPIVRLDAGKNLDLAVAELLAAAERSQKLGNLTQKVKFPT